MAETNYYASENGDGLFVGGTWLLLQRKGYAMWYQANDKTGGNDSRSCRQMTGGVYR